MPSSTTPLPLSTFVERFHATFRETENTVLLGGFHEPLYVPSEDESKPDEIRFTSDWIRSALHEVAHWCLAGRKRRKLLDYGYWYHPDGRNGEQQEAFFRAEARPQALEWIFALIAGVPFQLSLDNVTGAQIETTRFQAEIRREFASFAERGLPARAKLFARTLAGGADVDVPLLFREHGNDPIS